MTLSYFKQHAQTVRFKMINAWYYFYVVYDIKKKALSIFPHCSRSVSISLRLPVCSFHWSDWLLWEVTVSQSLGNSIRTRTIYSYYIQSECADTHKSKRAAHAQTPMYILHPILTWSSTGTCTRSRQTRRFRHRNRQRDAPTYAAVMPCLFLSALNNPNLWIFWLCHGGQREERPGSPLQTTSLPTHCTNLMTSSLCTIHRSWTCPVMTASAIYTVCVALRHTVGIYESRRSLCCWSLLFH